ncbi:MAG: ATP synthase subunit I [Chlorobiaceae bacterium]|nr:ATP synthase subunit I [Chlorobiaceae bacterium]
MAWIDLPALTGGSLLGIFFFGGLWLTVRIILPASRPGLWFMASMALRTATTLAGFVVIAGGSSTRLLCCTTGFVAAKMLLVGIAGHGSRSNGNNRPNREGPCI